MGLSVMLMQTRKALIIMVIVIVAAAVSPVSAAGKEGPFADVPASTWPYAIIDHFSAKGWLTGFEGGLYTEGRVLSRYELALMTGDILDRAARLGGWGLQPREVAWLQLLAKEYAPELALLGYRLEEEDKAGAASLIQSFVLFPRTRPDERVFSSAAFLKGGSRSSDRLRLEEDASAELSSALGRTLSARDGRFTLAADGTAGMKAHLRGLRLRENPGAFDLPHLAVASAQPSLTIVRSALGRDGAEQGAHREGRTDGSETTALASLARRQGGSRSRGGVQFGARAHVSWVERTTDAWRQAAFPTPNRYALDDDELGSYDLVLHLGDVRVTADRSSWWRGNAPAPGASSLAPVGFGDARSLYGDGFGAERTFSRDGTDPTTIASRAGLDMDLFVPSARLRLGWRYESDFDRESTFDGKTVAGVEYQLDSRASALAGIAHTAREDGTTRTTQLGLRYSLGRDSSLLLGYRLVDFTQLEEEGREDVRTKMATAEFVLRF